MTQHLAANMSHQRHRLFLLLLLSICGMALLQAYPMHDTTFCSKHVSAKAPTLHILQADRANSISQSQGLREQVNYQVADALYQPFRDGQFDLIWSMESGEHMPDKAQFIRELSRVCKPGGKILIVTWCHR